MTGKNRLPYARSSREPKNPWGSARLPGCVGCRLVNHWHDPGCLRTCRVAKSVSKESLVPRKERRSAAAVASDRDGALLSCRIGPDREDGCGGGVSGRDDRIASTAVRRAFRSILYFGSEGLSNLQTWRWSASIAAILLVVETKGC